MAAENVTAIQCTHCGAPLTLHGGGRIATVTCSYCGSVLDMNDHYKVLTQFRELQPPPVPLKLGMRGTIRGVAWTIIGWIKYASVDEPSETWSEFSLYSEIYGYGWLVYEAGVFLFSRRVRDFPLLRWEAKRHPRTVFYRQGHFVASEGAYVAEIEYVQGELSWVAHAGDQTTCWDYNGAGRRSLSIEKSPQETEVYLNETLLTPRVYSAFSLEPDREHAIHGTEGIDAAEGDTERAPLSTYTRGMLLLAGVLLLALLASLLTPKLIFQEVTSRPFRRMVTVDSDAFLTHIRLKAPSSTVLDTTHLTLYRGDHELYSIDRRAAHTSDVLLQETWKHGDNAVDIFIKLPTGTYRLDLVVFVPSRQQISVTVYERTMRLWLIVPLFLLIAVLAFPGLKRRFLSSDMGKIVGVMAVGTAGIYWLGIGVVVALLVLYFTVVKPVKEGKVSWQEVLNDD